MRVWAAVAGVVAGLLVLTSAPAGAQRPGNRRQVGSLKVGDPAPDFTIQDTDGKQTLTLSARKGRPVVLVFGSCT
jgi:cytochrome oxidase Cu insertion factor (SCO1/SenC/PrrC family)